MTAFAWLLIGAAIVVVATLIAVARLVDLMERYRADLDGDEIDGGWLFDAPYPHTRNNAAGEKGEGRGVKAFDTHCGEDK